MTAGQTATFSVTATGTAPLSYQWQKNGTAISGATSSSYTTPAETTSDNGALFTVVVTNSVGSVTSNAATLTVNPRRWRRRSPRSRQPDRDRGTDGNVLGDRNRNCAAELSVAEERHRHQRSDFVELHHPGGNDSSDNGAQFTVVVTNSAGSVTSNAATLTVNPAPVAPSITTQPRARRSPPDRRQRSR